MTTYSKRNIYIPNDIENLGGLAFGGISSKMTNGKSHVHVPIVPKDKEIKSVEICSTIPLVATNAMKWAATVNQLRADGKLSEELYKKCFDKTTTITKGFCSSPVIAMPSATGLGFTVKVKIGDSATPGASECEQSVHSVAFSGVVDAIYDQICEMLDNDLAFKMELLQKSGVAPNMLSVQSKKPAKELIEHPIKHQYYMKDTEINGVVKRLGEKIEHEPGVFTLKPIISSTTDAFGNPKKLSEGAFLYDSMGGSSGDVNTKADTIWWTRFEYVVPHINQQGKRRGGELVLSKCIEEVAPFMYVSDSNRSGPNGPKIKIPPQQLFNLFIDFTCQLPTLYFSNGAGHLMFKTFRIVVIEKCESKRSHNDPSLNAFYAQLGDSAYDSDSENADSKNNTTMNSQVLSSFGHAIENTVPNDGDNVDDVTLETPEQQRCDSSQMMITEEAQANTNNIALKRKELPTKDSNPRKKFKK